MNILKPLLFVSSIIITTSCYSQRTLPSDSIQINDSLIIKVDEEASFPGGLELWKKFLKRNANASITSDNGAPIGKFTVIVQFVVDIDGSTSNFKALTNLGYGLEEEVLRVIKLSGPWKPAIWNGKPIKAYRKQPLTFVSMDDNIEIETKTPYTLFTGIDNELIIRIKEMKNKNLNVTISQGSIASVDDGRYIAKLSEPGRVTIHIYDTKKNKEVGVASFEVRTATK